jgi:hypothetical protein
LAQWRALREFTDVARRLPRALIGWLLWQLRSHLPEATGARLALLTATPPYQINTTLRSRGKEQSIKLNYGSLYAVVESLQKLMAGLPPEEVGRLLDERADALRLELRSLEAAGDFGEEMGLPEIFVVESHYRHAMLTAELAFVVDLAKRIRSSELGGTKVWRRMHELFAQGMPFEEILEDPVRHLGEEARILAGQQPRP